VTKSHSLPTRREDLALTGILADSRGIPAVDEKTPVGQRIDEALERLQRTPVGGASSEVLVRYRNEGSPSHKSYGELMEVLAEAVNYDLISASTNLILEPQRSLDLGNQQRVLLGAFSYPGDPGLVVVMLRFDNTGGSDAALADVSDIQVSDTRELGDHLEKLAEKRAEAIGPDDRLLGHPVSRSVLVLTPATLAVLADPETGKRRLRAVAAVEGVQLRVIVANLTIQNDTRRLNVQLAGMNLDLVVAWTRTYEQLPHRLLPDGIVRHVSSDSEPDALEQFRALLAQHVDEIDTEHGSVEVDTLTAVEIDALRESLEATTMRIVVAGGNDRQRLICDRIERDLRDQVGLSFGLVWMTGWTSAAAARGALTGSEGLVWSELVGHTLGEALRREADAAGVAHTKVIGTGTGRGAISRAVVEAIRLAMRRRHSGR
jgi:hypothetical protein